MFTTNKATLTGASFALGLTAIMSPIAPSAQAVTLTYSGNTFGGPTWNRPNQIRLQSSTAQQQPFHITCSSLLLVLAVPMIF